MVITCPACEARYRLNRDKITGRGAKITCPKCSHVFVVFNDADDAGKGASEAVEQPPADATAGRISPPPSSSRNNSLDPETTTGAFRAVLGSESESDNLQAHSTGTIRVVAPGKRGSRRTVATVESGNFDMAVESLREEPVVPAPADAPSARSAADLNFREVGIKTWKVKVAIGLIYDFSDISTLKKYLGDKKVTPDDLISHNNKDWTRIGDIADLDAHFVTIWEEAKRRIETGEAPAVQKKKPAKAVGNETARVSSELSSTMSAATAEATGSQKAIPTSVPGAYGGRKSRRQGKKGREEEKSGPSPTAWILAAILVIGGFAAWRMQPQSVGDAPTPVPVAVDAVGELKQADKDAIAKKLEEDLKKRQEELARAERSKGIESVGDEVTKDDSLEARRARGELQVNRDRAPVRRNPTTNDGFRRPIKQAPQSATGTTQSSGTTQVKSAKDPGLLYLSMAKKKLASNDYGAAQKAALTATQKSPNCMPCWNTLGEAYQKLGQQQQASEAFAKAESLAKSGSSATAGQ